MNWLLFVVIASSLSDKVVNSATIPMATEQLCNSAKMKLTEDFERTRSPNFALATECLRTR
jgi:hypothetical protein